MHAVVIHSYDAFGNLLATDNSQLATLLSFRFSTKYLDPETGFYYYGYRYYDPDLGRWLTRDPLEEQGGLNLYGFCGNDAVNRWDKLGLRSCCCRESGKRYEIKQPISWSGWCGVFDGGLFAGGTWVSCSLESDITPDCKKWNIGVQGFYAGLISPGAGSITFYATFTGAEKPEDFKGFSALIGGGGTLIGGFSLGKIKLGKAVSSGWLSLNIGIDFGASAMVGWAQLLSKTEIPCSRW